MREIGSEGREIGPCRARDKYDFDMQVSPMEMAWVFGPPGASERAIKRRR